MSRVRVCALTDVLGLDPLRQSLVHVMSDLWLGEGGGGGWRGQKLHRLPWNPAAGRNMAESQA